eukprot:5204756-Amphidinium_carterae.1
MPTDIAGAGFQSHLMSHCKRLAAEDVPAKIVAWQRTLRTLPSRSKVSCKSTTPLQEDARDIQAATDRPGWPLPVFGWCHHTKGR